MDPMAAPVGKVLDIEAENNLDLDRRASSAGRRTAVPHKESRHENRNGGSSGKAEVRDNLQMKERLSAGSADRRVLVQVHHSAPFDLMGDQVPAGRQTKHPMNCSARTGAVALCVQRHGAAEGQADCTRPPPHNPPRSPRFRVIQVQDLGVGMKQVLVLVASVEACVWYEGAMMPQCAAGVIGGQIPTRNQKDEYRREVRLEMRGRREGQP
jgi:hypothetical protein